MNGFLGLPSFPLAFSSQSTPEQTVNLIVHPTNSRQPIVMHPATMPKSYSRYILSITELASYLIAQYGADNDFMISVIEPAVLSTVHIRSSLTSSL